MTRLTCFSQSQHFFKLEELLIQIFFFKTIVAKQLLFDSSVSALNKNTYWGFVCFFFSPKVCPTTPEILGIK